jgi:hypothetical protein
VLFGLFMAGAFVAVNYATVNMYFPCSNVFTCKNFQRTNGFVSQECELTSIESKAYAKPRHDSWSWRCLSGSSISEGEASDPREPVVDSAPVGRDLLFASFPERVPHAWLASTPTPVGEGGDFSSIPLIYSRPLLP